MNALKKTCLYHLLLSVGLAIILAMQVYLQLTDAAKDVIASSLFLLIMWLGPPLLIIMLAAIFYTLQVRHENRARILLAALAVVLLQWVIQIQPAILISIATEGLYIVLTVLITSLTLSGGD